GDLLLHPETRAESLHERRLPGAELAGQQDEVAGCRQGGDRRGEGAGGVDAGRAGAQRHERGPDRARAWGCRGTAQRYRGCWRASPAAASVPMASATTATTRLRTTSTSASTRPVAAATNASPSTAVCEGDTARARPSWADWARRWQATLSRR